MLSSASRQPIATRQLSKAVLKEIGPQLPWLIGGSADLAGSTGTDWGCGVFDCSHQSGQFLNYGVREFAMFSIANGLAQMGCQPYVGTFLVFADYGRNAIRLAAMMKLSVVYVFTHDSIGLGEDGPTHQPVEHLAILRATPGLETWRPANGQETALAWQEALSREGPTAIVLSRQSCAAIPIGNTSDLLCGAQMIHDVDQPECIVIATGSEVGSCYEAINKTSDLKTRVRLISCPCLSRFLKSSQRKNWLESGVPVITVEAGSSLCWGDLQPNPLYRIALDEYGLSGKGQDVMAKFGFDVASIVTKLQQICKGLSV